MTDTLRVHPGELRQNDMFRLAGVLFNVSNVDIDEETDEAIVTADQMIGRQTWTIQIRTPRDVPFHILK